MFWQFRKEVILQVVNFSSVFNNQFNKYPRKSLVIRKFLLQKSITKSCSQWRFSYYWVFIQLLNQHSTLLIAWIEIIHDGFVQLQTLCNYTVFGMTWGRFLYADLLCRLVKFIQVTINILIPYKWRRWIGSSTNYSVIYVLKKHILLWRTCVSFVKSVFTQRKQLIEKKWILRCHRCSPVGNFILWQNGL